MKRTAKVSKKASRLQWNQSSLTEAVKAVAMGRCFKRKAALQYAVPRATLQRHLKNNSEGKSITFSLRRPTALTSEQEEELVAHIRSMEAPLYGLTPADVRVIVYEYCK